MLKWEVAEVTLAIASKRELWRFRPSYTCPRQEVFRSRGSQNIWQKILPYRKFTTGISGYLLPGTSSELGYEVLLQLRDKPRIKIIFERTSTWRFPLDNDSLGCKWLWPTGISRKFCVMVQGHHKFSRCAI